MTTATTPVTNASQSTNQPAAYVVRFENERKRADLSYFLADYANDYGTQDEHGAFSDAIANAQPIDLDALRLVLEAANCHFEDLDRWTNDPQCPNDQETRKECDALGDAIAKLSHLTK